MKVSVVPFDYDDPYRDDSYDAVTACVRELESMGFHGDPQIDIGRTRRAAIDRANPATARLIQLVPGAGAWLDLVPTALALDLCYHPDGQRLPNGQVITPELRRWASNLADTSGIRSRAAAFTQVVIEALGSRSGQQWLSLACGAAKPVIDALVAVESRGGQIGRLTLIDLDKRALSLARSYAPNRNIADRVVIRRHNILDPRGVFGRRSASAEPTYDLVEAVGLLEYLRDDDWPYRYGSVIRTTRQLAGARTFLRNAWSLVKPGGILVVGNMLDSHPQLAFTLNVIQWPHVQPRPTKSVTRLLHEVCGDASMRIVLPSDGVYALYVVRKPSHTD